MNCRAACRAQSEALDHPLPLTKMTGLRLHLLLCGWCRRYGKHISFLHGHAKQHDQTLDKGRFTPLSHEARERMKQLLKQDK